MLANSHAGGDAPAFHLEVSQSTQYKRILSVQMLRPTDLSSLSSVVDDSI